MSTSITVPAIAGSRRFVAFGILALINLIHPWIHAFEAGGLDAILIQVDAWAMWLDPFLPHSHDACDDHFDECD